MPYAELHCVTNFSFLRGASHPHELVQRAAELGYQALAITDECSLAGVVKAHVAALEHDLQLIIGSEFKLDGQRLLVLVQRKRIGHNNQRYGSSARTRGEFLALAQGCIYNSAHAKVDSGGKETQRI